MSWRAAWIWIAFFAIVGLLGSQLDPFGGGTRRPSPEGTRLSSVGRVVRVIDGDTVRVRLGHATRSVRYIGVDTPETVKPGTPVQCFGKRASAFNRRLVSGRRVQLRFGRERFDRYGRLLAYVYVVGGGRRSVSATLVARGYGRVLTIPPNDQHARAYAKLEGRARRDGRGLWGACP